MANNMLSSSPYPARLLPITLHHPNKLPECFLPLRLKQIVPVNRQAHRDLLFARLQPSNSFVSELRERHAN